MNKPPPEYIYTYETVARSEKPKNDETYKTGKAKDDKEFNWKKSGNKTKRGLTIWVRAIKRTENPAYKAYYNKINRNLAALAFRALNLGPSDPSDPSDPSNKEGWIKKFFNRKPYRSGSDNNAAMGKGGKRKTRRRRHTKRRQTRRN